MTEKAVFSQSETAAHAPSVCRTHRPSSSTTAVKTPMVLMMADKDGKQMGTNFN